MKQVKSSNISAIGYDGTLNQMQVDFKDGSSYVYDGVSYGTYFQIVNDPQSVGKAFQKFKPQLKKYKKLPKAVANRAGVNHAK